MKKTRLENGVTVNVCCASCIYKIDNYPSRKCGLRDDPVQPESCCRRWRPAKRYTSLKPGEGYIKTREYLVFANAIACENEQLPVSKRVPVEEMRRRYKRMFRKGIIEL